MRGSTKYLFGWIGGSSFIVALLVMILFNNMSSSFKIKLNKEPSPKLHIINNLLNSKNIIDISIIKSNKLYSDMAYSDASAEKLVNNLSSNEQNKYFRMRLLESKVNIMEGQIRSIVVIEKSTWLYKSINLVIAALLWAFGIFAGRLILFYTEESVIKKFRSKETSS